MKKIGIMTHCIANNFGANLQALSTASYLQRNGFCPVFFFWDAYLKKRSLNMNKTQLDLHRNFLSRHGFEVSSPCCSDDDFVHMIKENDIHNILVGSDAVLTVESLVDRLTVRKLVPRIRPKVEDKEFPNPFWVPFAKKLKDCSFFYLSPSCQSSNYEFLRKKKVLQMKRQMQLFSYLSARDSYTAKMIRYLSECNCEVPVTPDPVWGFNQNVSNIPSKDDVVKKFGIEKDYILTSYYKNEEPSKDWLDELRNVAKENGVEVYALPMPQGIFCSNLPQIQLPIDPLDWYALIRYSKGYVGNNMHPIIVAMHNCVPFYSVDQHGKKIGKFLFDKTSKVYDLLQRFNMLEYRIKATKIKKVSAARVFYQLQNFDRNREREISQKMSDDYMDMMKNICSMFL